MQITTSECKTPNLNVPCRSLQHDPSPMACPNNYAWHNKLPGWLVGGGWSLTRWGYIGMQSLYQVDRCNCESWSELWKTSTRFYVWVSSAIALNLKIKAEGFFHLAQSCKEKSSWNPVERITCTSCNSLAGPPHLAASCKTRPSSSCNSLASPLRCKIYNEHPAVQT